MEESRGALLFQKVCIITEQAPTAVTSKYTKLVNSFLDFLENSL